MRRREFITLLGVAQETGKVRRIGFLRVGEPPAAFIDGFRRGLREVESLSRFAEEQHVISWFEET